MQGGEQRVFHHGDIGGVENPLEPVAAIQRFRQMENMAVAVVGGAYDELGALTGRSKGGGVAVLDQLLFVLLTLLPNEPHGG